MYPLHNRILHYTWGSRTALADLLGGPSPSAEPEAELWIGAHPTAPSLVQRGEVVQSLLEWITEDPETTLGRSVSDVYGTRLPFLLKVLAVSSPLSLQVHPDSAQARDGFLREVAGGTASSAPERNYPDEHHKPEFLCALTDFIALCGFRGVEETIRLLDDLRVPALKAVQGALEDRPDSAGLRRAFSALMVADKTDHAALTADVVHACRRLAKGDGEFAEACAETARLAEVFPADHRVVTTLFLNLVRLRAGQGLFIPPRTIHSYLRGVGIEVMATSDNVVRGGLTVKHVNVSEFLGLVDFQMGPHDPVEPERGNDAAEELYRVPAREFRLSRFQLGPGERVLVRRSPGPEILLTAEGEATLEPHGVVLPRGRAVFVPATGGPYSLIGDATVFRVSIPGPWSSAR
jgi:mannose-6-phosphate isomerase